MKKEKVFLKPECDIVIFLDNDIITSSSEFDLEGEINGENTPIKP